jgi:hypothetical protein
MKRGDTGAMQKSFRRSARNAVVLAVVLFIGGTFAFSFAGDANLGPAILGASLWGLGAVYILVAIHYWMASNRYVPKGEQRGFEPLMPTKQDERT